MPGTLIVIGASEGDVCGVRDYAEELSRCLSRESIDVEQAWFNRHDMEPVELLRSVESWRSAAVQSIQSATRPTVLVHYSVFSYCYRGLPILIPSLCRLLAATEAGSIITVLHELAYPWGRQGWRGRIWAFTHRVALTFVVRRSTALVVTTEDRASWVDSRSWLSHRPVFVAPVFSNIPAPSSGSTQVCSSRPRIGLFGFAHESILSGVVLDGLVLVRRAMPHCRLVLLGSPGADSLAGRSWREAAERRGVGAAIEFTGVLSAQDLSDALAACGVLVFADAVGPSSRKTTLAASLASGRPVIALEGPQAWRELVESDSLSVVRPTPEALAEEVQRLLGDSSAADGLGARGRAFAEERMSVEQVASVVLRVVRDVVATS